MDTDTARLGELDEAEWRGHQAALVALAEAGGGGEAVRRRRHAALEHLREVDELLVGGMVASQERLRRQLGRALVALGHGGLWPALYALTDCSPEAEIRAGDAEAFLAQDDVQVPVPPLPEGLARAVVAAWGSRRP